MGMIGEAIQGEGMGYVWLFVGNLLSRLAKNSYVRYALFFVVLGGLLWGSNRYHQQFYPKNLFRKHGITRHSSEKQIKDLYRKFARENHPDMRRSAGYSRKDFAVASQEFKVLTHKSMRLQYDKFGEVNSEANIYSNMGFKVTSVLGSFLFYLGQGIFLMAFTSEDQSVRIKSGCFYLTIALLLYELFTIFARTDAMKDPLDFVYPDMTLRERLNFIQTTFLGYLFLFVFYKHAFTLSLSMRFQVSSGYVMMGIKVIQRDFELRKAQSTLASQQPADPVKEELGAGQPPAFQTNHLGDAAAQPNPSPAEAPAYIEDPVDESLQATLKEHFRCIAEYVIAIATVQREPVDAKETRTNAHKGLRGQRQLIDSKKYRLAHPKQPKSETDASQPNPPDAPADEAPADAEEAGDPAEASEPPKKADGILSVVWGLAKALLWMLAFNLTIRYLLR